jgi:ABC-type polysaccharide/polyol phosphate transport system ATPase subunit
MREIIKFENVSKNFKLYHDRSYTLKDYLLHPIKRKKSNYEVFRALDKVSFSILKGESVGIIGRNGSGKSTVLKLLSKIIYPTAGTISVTGRVSSLIELGAGFHPDFTGLENIYTNASIFGLSKKEVDRKLNTIIDFSELKKVIDTPVRTYSSGMYMRLAFSVAINVDPDVLFIDEILAVGDANFQKKCNEKLHDIKSNGTTIVIVSHDLSSIMKLCNRVIWVDRGCVMSSGSPEDVIKEYLEFMHNLETLSNPKTVLKEEK